MLSLLHIPTHTDPISQLSFFVLLKRINLAKQTVNWCNLNNTIILSYKLPFVNLK